MFVPKSSVHYSIGYTRQDIAVTSKRPIKVESGAAENEPTASQGIPNRYLGQYSKCLTSVDDQTVQCANKK